MSSTSTTCSTIERDQVDDSIIYIKNLDNIKASVISSSSCSSSVQSTSNIKLCTEIKDNNFFNNIALSIANDDINNDEIFLSKNDNVHPIVVDLNDPACWPQNMTHVTQIQIVERGPIQIVDFVFPLQEKSGRKFSIAHYNKTMSNG